MSLARWWSRTSPNCAWTEKQMKRWAGKRFIVLIEVAEVEEIPPRSPLIKAITAIWMIGCQ
jgi:hypothetical protein